MKKLTILLLAFISLQGSITIAWAERVLKGKVELVGRTGDTDPASNVSVTLIGMGKATVTDDVGEFNISLPLSLTFGGTLRFHVQKEINGTVWKIWDPIDGEIPLPQGLFVIIKLLPRGSMKFLTEEFIEYHLAKMAEKGKREVKPTADTSLDESKIHFGVLIKEWAAEYGFTPQEAKRQIDQWVLEVKEKQEDFYKLGLAAYAEQEFGKAAELFGTYAERHGKEYKQLADQAEPHRQKALQGYRKAGDSLYSNYQFELSLKEYEKALPYVNKQDEPNLWADVQMEIAGANWAIGIRTEGPAVQEHLDRAMEAYTGAAQGYETLGQEEGKANAQVGIGLILHEQGIRTPEEEEGRQLLGEAVVAFRAALKEHTRKKSPPQWAMTQNNLGNSLSELGIRTPEEEEGRRLLGEAVAAFRGVVEVYTRTQWPQHWATTQNNLGTVLYEQGIRTPEEEEGRRLLGEAVVAFRAALDVWTKDSSGLQWAQTHYKLAEASTELEDWEQVVVSYQNVLGVYPEDAELYFRTSLVLHEKLFRFAESFSLNQQWVAGHSDDLSAQMNFAEAHLTTGQFSEAEQRFAKLLARYDLDAHSTIPLRVLHVVSLVGQHKLDLVSGYLKEIGGSLETQPQDFTLGWSFEGTKHFIGQHEAFAGSREWLLPLLAEFSGTTRDTMLAAVKTAQTQFMAAESSGKILPPK